MKVIILLVSLSVLISVKNESLNIGEKMKTKSLIGVLSLGVCLSAFASSDNYRDLKVNDDGTSTIIGPAFTIATGGNARISSKSNRNGVCKLYGFDLMIGEGSITVGDDRERTAVIDGNGRYSAYTSYNNSYNNSYIDSIVCARNHQTLSVSARTQPLLNDDGSFTLLDPKVGHYDGGRVSRISGHSNLDGVCNYHGLGRALNATAIRVGDDRERTVVLESGGRFQGFKKYNNSYNNSYIKSLVCEAQAGYPDNNGEINETVEISRRELLRMQNLITKLQELTNVLRTDLQRTQAERDALRAQLEQAIADLEREVIDNGEAKRELMKLKAQLLRLAQ